MELFTDNRNTIKIISIVVAIVIAIFAILVFSNKIPGLESKSSQIDNVRLNVVGTIPVDYINKAIDNYNIKYKQTFAVNYNYVPEDTLIDSLVKYAARGYAPDIVLAKSNTILSNKELFKNISYSDPGAMSEILYKNTFIDGADIFSTGQGYNFYPMLVDPLITYYNKRLLRASGLTRPITSWGDLYLYKTRLTKYDEYRKPIQSAFAIGANNVVNNKQLFLLSLMQAAGKIVTNNYYIDNQGALANNYGFNLGDRPDSSGGASILYRILSMHEAFIDPEKDTYTWDFNGKNDYEQFLDNQLVFYFGKASDYNNIVQIRPDIDLGIYPIPQLSQDYNNHVYTGDIYGLAISKNTSNYAKSLSVAGVLSGPDISGFIASVMGVSSATEDVLAGSGNQERVAIIGTSALNSQFLFDIDTKASQSLIISLYKNIYSGRWSIDQAVDNFVDAFRKIYNPET